MLEVAYNTGGSLQYWRWYIMLEVVYNAGGGL